MNAYAEQSLEDLFTELAAKRLNPDTWVEAYPHGVFDAGHVGGDVQAGTAWCRRFVRFEPATGKWWVINDSYYLCECDHDEDSGRFTMDDGDGGTETRCKYCGPITWIQNEFELILCRDFRDPGSTEESADTTYDDTAGDFDWQITDGYARQCAEWLQADRYGEPGRDYER